MGGLCSLRLMELILVHVKGFLIRNNQTPNPEEEKHMKLLKSRESY